MSMIIAATACLPLNSVSAFAAENTEAGTTEAAAITEPEEIGEEEPETAVDEMVIDEPSAAEEVHGTESGEEAKAADTEEGTQTADPAEEVQAAEDEDSAEEEAAVQPEEEAQAEDTIEDAEDEEAADAGQGIEIPAGPETAGSDIISDLIIEEAVEDEVSRDAMEYGSDDYPYKNKSYGTYTSADVDPWKYYYRECTSFCAWRLNNTNGISFHNWYKGVNFGNAKTWINAAKQVGITVNNTPALGAVACWTTGDYGHVAWVCAVSGSSVTIEEYNWGTAGKYNKRTIAASNPSGYIHFKDLTPACEHSWGINSVQTAPTATAKGAWLFKCSKCGATSTREIPALGNTNLANGKYMILSKLGTNKYVSVTPYQSYQGGNIALYSKGVADQTFTISKNSNGSYLIKYGSFALDVKDQKFSATVQLYQTDGTKAQNWFIEDAGNGWYRLATQSTYFNMDVANAGTADGTNIGTHWNNGNDAQLFKFVKVNEPTNVSRLSITVNDAGLIYDGTAKTPAVTVKEDGKVVTNGFKVTYQNNVNAGLKTATVTITGDNVTYTGTKTAAFTIYPGKTPRGDMFNLANNVKVTWHEVPGAKYYKVYRTGVTDPGESLDEPVIVTDRLIGWDAKPGLTNGHAYRYKIVASLSGEGDRSGDSPLSYSKLMYRLKTVVIRSVKNTSAGAVTVKYDKTTSGDSYVLQYSENQDMSNAQTRVVKGADTTSYTIGGLKKGKTYYISIRVRKTVDGINYYTTFGVAKKITITK